MRVCTCVCVVMCVCVCVAKCGSALTPLRGGLVRDSMETLSERVSVREEKRGRGKCAGRVLGRGKEKENRWREK